ncbi:MAG: hypothetical protein JWP69_1524 [Flaviaesturariibacter sp.]|nr:hypothetical protein [Flaviaesturariibacter sp.]
MQILLCAATPFEIESTTNFIKKQGLNQKIDVLITGVGLVATTYTLMKQIISKRPDIMLQAGIGGCFDQAIPLSQTVAINKDTIGDLGVIENDYFRTVFELNLLSSTQSPWQEGWLTNPHAPLLEMCGLPQAAGVSVNQITTQKNMVAHFKNTLGAHVESMEGAAFHYLGLQENIPFLQVRSLSNYVGERNKAAWQLAPAIESLNTSLQEVLIKLLPA